METPRALTQGGVMRLWWNHLWMSKIYRRATAAERRLIEIRFSVARTVKRKRREARITQAVLATRIATTRNTISRIERASNRVSLDHALKALIDLDCTDAEIADAFNPESDPGIVQLRRAAARPLYPRPLTSTPPDELEHRFIRQRPRDCSNE